jgi:hypothetical protein
MFMGLTDYVRWGTSRTRRDAVQVLQQLSAERADAAAS